MGANPQDGGFPRTVANPHEGGFLRLVANPHKGGFLRSVANPSEGSSRMVATPHKGGFPRSGANPSEGLSLVGRGGGGSPRAVVQPPPQKSLMAQQRLGARPAPETAGRRPGLWARPDLQLVEVPKPLGTSHISLDEVANRIRGFSQEEVLQLLELTGHLRSQGQEALSSRVLEGPSQHDALYLQGGGGGSSLPSQRYSRCLRLR